MRKDVVVATVGGENLEVLESKAWDVLEGCQVLRPNDDCPSRSGTAGRAHRQRDVPHSRTHRRALLLPRRRVLLQCHGGDAGSALLRLL